MTRTSKTLTRLCVPGIAAATLVAGLPLVGVGITSASAQATVNPTRLTPVDCPAGSGTTTTTNTLQGGTNNANAPAPGQCRTQAQVNTLKPVSFQLTDENGAPASGRTVNFTLPAGAAAVFAGSQPGQTQVTAGAKNAICTTDAAGQCTVNVTSTAVEDAVVTATASGFTTDDPTTPAVEAPAAATLTADETIRFRAQAVTAARLVETSRRVVAPDTTAIPTPGRPVEVTYMVNDASDLNVAGQALTLTLNRAAFFTPNCTPTTLGTTTPQRGVADDPDTAAADANPNRLVAPNFLNCSFTPAPAAGQQYGSLTSLGQTTTVTTDRNGRFTVTIAEGRDSALDETGTTAVSLTASGTGITPFGTTGDPAVGSGPGGTNNQTTDIADPVRFFSVAPLNGTSVRIVAVDGPDEPAFSNTSTNNIQDRINVGADTPIANTRVFVVQLRDQFGNLTQTRQASGLAGAFTPVGTVPATSDRLTLTKTGSGDLQGPGVGSAGNPGTTDEVANNVAGSFLLPAAQSRYSFVTRNVNTSEVEQGLASLIASWQAPRTTFTFAGTNPRFNGVSQSSPVTLTDTVNLDVYTPVPSVTIAQTPNQDRVPAGTVVTQQATVRDQRNQAIRSATVTFLRSGTSNDCTNSNTNGTGSGSTGLAVDNQGRASFTFTCATASQQNITVVAQGAGNNELARAQRSVTFGDFVVGTPAATATATTTATTAPATTAPATTAPATTAPATPTGTPSAPVFTTCVNPAGISLSRAFITPGVPVTVTVTAPAGAEVELQAYSRPSTEYRQVRRSVVGQTGQITFDVTPGTNTRLFAACVGQTRSASASQVINVRTALSLTVVRNGTRNYTFQGRILPRRAGQLISLYRVTNDGTRILTSQLKTDATGTYRLNRRFTGSGVFGFLTRTGQTLTNAAGESNTPQTIEGVNAGRGNARPTAIF